ncbi:hypothetical protein C4K46_06355 [Streptococcus oricebi]|uniref:Gram-positive cocci surface proteins LPxTG domain-containing protein n=2 Tax=Streptococcus oricebi TaxID=1547447 RepID=A0ABS5B409_9STRE|nr:hypothetical protein [Streptococcus oricebi]
MYKKGKFWVVASIAVGLASANQVLAEETAPAPAEGVPDAPAAQAPTEEKQVVVDEGQAPATGPVYNAPAAAEVAPAASPEKAQEAPTPADQPAGKEVAETANPAQEASVSDKGTNKQNANSLKTGESPEVLTDTKQAPVAAPNYTSSNYGRLGETAQKLVAEAGFTDAQLDQLTDVQIEALNRVRVDDTAEAGTRMTYKNFADIAQSLIDQDPRYAIPFFKADAIRNMDAATTRNAQSGKVEELEVWDSWPVQDVRTKLVANWNGYQLAVAMMGVPGTNDNHLYLVYNKYGDNNLQNWKNAGSIFGYGLSENLQQWSGSAIVNKDGSIQLYYTQVDGSEGTNHQKLASITLNLEHNDKDVWIKSTENDQVIFEGDGYHYQTYDQWKETNRGADNTAMRDAHIVEDENGDRYIIFESSTGTENYQGEDQVYNWKNYGGTAAENIKNLFQVINNPDIKSRASWANASLGIIKLTNDEKAPKVDKVYSPLITANMVSDEIERPSLVQLNGKYYLFAATRLNRGSNDDAWEAANKAIGDNVAMIGYVSDSLLGGYKPLNESGVVLTATVPADWRTATYSYFAVPVEGSNDTVLMTSYITNRNGVAGPENKASWGPSFLVKILPDGTTRVLAKMTQQGDWIWDEGSESQDMVGTLETAKLPNEDYYVDWELIGYNLKDHKPIDDPADPKKDNSGASLVAPLVYDPGELVIPADYDPNDPNGGQGAATRNLAASQLANSKDPSGLANSKNGKDGQNPDLAKASALPSTGTVATQASILAGIAGLVGVVFAGAAYRRKEERD